MPFLKSQKLKLTACKKLILTKFKKTLMKVTQKACVRSKCRTMLTKYRELDFILDDESYFTLDHSAQPQRWVSEAFLVTDTNTSEDIF